MLSHIQQRVLRSLPSVLNQNAFAALSTDLQKYFNRVISVKILNEDLNKTEFYRLKPDASFDTILTELTDKTNTDFNLDSNFIWEFIPYKYLEQLPNQLPAHRSFNEAMAPDIISFLNVLHPSNQDLGTRPAWWITTKAGDTFYLRRQRHAFQSISSVPDTNTLFTCSVCMGSSNTINMHYACRHHLCNLCHEGWTASQNQRHNNNCPECRAVRR
jgi:hypothetical protein